VIVMRASWMVLFAACSSSPSPSTPPPQDGPADLDAAIVDADGDGIDDANDLCLAFPSPDNHDHDGDLAGDPCDPCPHLAAGLASQPDVDSDGDGLGDGCDPRPTAAGDRRGAFFGFYDSADLGGWEPDGIGTWTIDGGKLVVDAVAVGQTHILAPPVLPPNLEIQASVDIRALSTATVGSRSGGVLAVRNSVPAKFHTCRLSVTNTTAQVRYTLGDNLLGGGSFTIPYGETVIRDGHDYRLRLVDGLARWGVDGAPSSSLTNGVGAPAPTRVGAIAEGASIAIDYVFVAELP